MTSSLEVLVGVKSYFPRGTQDFQDFRKRFCHKFRSDYPGEDQDEPETFAVQGYNAGRLLENLDSQITLRESNTMEIVNVIGNGYHSVYWTQGLGNLVESSETRMMVGVPARSLFTQFEQKFDAVVGEVMFASTNYDLADFTQPYTESGLEMIVPVQARLSNQAWLFMEPFTKYTWGLLAAITIYNALNSGEITALFLEVPLAKIFYLGTSRASSERERHSKLEVMDLPNGGRIFVGMSEGEWCMMEMDE
uniref:Uncharacterized protein n=1 Tax=Tanacetum cinerariifolium TaxID=118510 RepID=A0A6L2LYS6_TANCI|nr:hypothetical protein [Tanacetum cinerariifolium]